MTKYLKSVLTEYSHSVIPFKDDNFVDISYVELLTDEYDINDTHPLCVLLNSSEYNKLFEKFPKEKSEIQIVQVRCIASYKTLKTVFEEQERVKRYIPELTGVYYFPFTISFKRNPKAVTVKYEFNKDDMPWYAGSFVTPKYIKDIPNVASMEKVDDYKSGTTEIRAKINTWQDYIRYCDDLFNATANLSLKYEEKCFIFRHDMDKKAIVDPIVKLYESLEGETEHKLYDNFTALKHGDDKPLTSNNDVDSSFLHCGQMNGKFSLAASQREAVNCMNIIRDGEILAVSGPPGTGKTTLLQSVVSDMVVKSALDSKEPPVIVAVSANNQAVTNIIDSFSSVKSVGVLNLEERWIDGVKGFAVYMPSSFKLKEAQKKGYQCTAVRDYSFINEIENKADCNIKMMVECAGRYFGKSFRNVGEVKENLKNELKVIDDLRKKLILISKEIQQFTDGKELMEFTAELKHLKIDLENEKNQYQCRYSEWQKIKESVSLFKRVFSFIPYFKKQISHQIAIAALPEETLFIDKETSFDKIFACYANKISSKNNELMDLAVKIDKAEDFVKQIRDEILKLRSKNCSLPLLNDNDLVEFNPNEINNLIDTKIRYVEFWLAVHINECRFLEDEYKVTEKQKATNYRNVIEKFYKRIALLSPCFVMTVYKMPSNFNCCGGYLFDYIDLLIFDEAGQCSPEIAAAGFSLAKKAIVVGDECQIPPVYNLDTVMDITLAMQNKVIAKESDFEKLADCGLSCSQGSVMKAAKKSCIYSSNDKIRGMFLCEHRRCYDEIIDYCNELVYDGLLIPLRNTDEASRGCKRVLDSAVYPVVGLFDISSANSENVGGSRKNEIEALRLQNG